MGELELPDELSSRKLRTQLLLLAAILLTGVAIVTLLAYRAITLWVPAILGSAAFLSLHRTVRDAAHEILGDPETKRAHPRASTRALHGRDRHAHTRS